MSITTNPGKLIGFCLAFLIAIILGLLAFFNIAGAFEPSMESIDNNFDGSPGTDAYDSIVNGGADFFAFAPIIVIVIAVVVILGFVRMNNNQDNYYR